MAKSSLLFLQKTPLQMFKRVLNNPQHSVPMLRLASSAFKLSLKHIPAGEDLQLHSDAAARRCFVKR